MTGKLLVIYLLYLFTIMLVSYYITTNKTTIDILPIVNVILIAFSLTMIGWQR